MGMANVIDFAAVVSARRAAVRVDFNAKAGAEIIASVVMSLRAAERTLPTFTPAYCDPHNETRGAKHDATRALSLVDIAGRMRADIKALGIPKGVKVSVRKRSNAIDIEIVGLPADFPVMSAKAASWRKQFGNTRDYPFAWVEARSAQLDALLIKLGRVHAAYNRDNSDSMTDYFDCRYYGTASIDSRLRCDREAIEVAASPGSYWAD